MGSEMCIRDRVLEDVKIFWIRGVLGKESLAEEFDEVDVEGVRVIWCEVVEEIPLGAHVLE